MKLPVKKILLIIYVGIFANTNAQPVSSVPVKQLIKEKKYDKAALLIDTQINSILSSNAYDSLATFIVPFGTIAVEQTGANKGAQKLKQLVIRIKSVVKDPTILKGVLSAAGAFYEDENQHTLAYDTNMEILEIERQSLNPDQKIIASLEADLAVFAQRKGNAKLSGMHTRNAMRIRETFSVPDYEDLYQSYNGMGTMFWFAAQTDSAGYFFNKALDALAKTDSNAYNRYYRPAIILNNLAAIYSLQGKMNQAIQAMQTTISDIKKFLDSPDDHPKRKTAVEFQFQAIDNLGGLYKELGNYTQARELLNYSWQQKKIHFKEENPEIFKSEILLGQVYKDLRNFEKAEPLLISGLKKATGPNGDGFFAADGAYTLALLYEGSGKPDRAARYFEMSDSLYSLAYEGDYDNIYLDFVRNASLFYAENNMPSKALQMAMRSYNYVQKNKAGNLLPLFEAVNLSEVYFRNGMYADAIKRSDEAINLVNKNIANGSSLMDSVLIEFRKPRAILMRVKSEYMMLDKKDTASLKNILAKVQSALQILERRNSLLHDPENTKLVISDQRELVNFIKQLQIELFEKTQDPKYIDEMLGIHESTLYHRIRARLDVNEAMQFNGVPVSVRNRELEIRSMMKSAITNEQLDAFLAAEKEWSVYTEEIRSKYPVYYAIRFSNLFRPVADIMQKIPGDIQVIRYVFAGKKLYAVVFSRETRFMTVLENQNIGEEIEIVNDSRTPFTLVVEKLNSLYKKLWQPFADQIQKKRIIIIPDDILFNLSFETLTHQNIRSYSELSTQSLLGRYNIAYNYSLFLIQPIAKNENFDQNFVAFAPGFSDEVKKEYLDKKLDSMNIDRGYLSLLPLPFTLRLASSASRLLDGKTFLMNQSTLSAFKQIQGNFRVIHIGTHAEANNQYPEYSRLIFAKDLQHPLDTNSLFLFDIYNCKLNSNLTVLTACETGKPGLEDGEGMISLGHAFNYAGSESMLTSLWKIDEQSSAMIMESFYKFLQQGSAKDEALRQAKLEYLASARGRMLAPQYWAGLVIVGDTAPIDLKKSGQWKWFAGISILVLLSVYTLRSKMKKSA
ncbi:CHAT domain-containing tetratricopeptide repeat protein [Pollutibacter soli]|uniref:CHAT domain-containing protein n=1 Tax=Pollutibacter soli TaxID=3034157 RepID=UPI003013A77B